jgi:hypothetical protein
VRNGRGGLIDAKPLADLFVMPPNSSSAGAMARIRSGDSNRLNIIAGCGLGFMANSSAESNVKMIHLDIPMGCYLIASRDIAKDEEVLFDYKWNPARASQNVSPYPCCACLVFEHHLSIMMLRRVVD